MAPSSKCRRTLVESASRRQSARALRWRSFRGLPRFCKSASSSLEGGERQRTLRSTLTVAGQNYLRLQSVAGYIWSWRRVHERVNGRGSANLPARLIYPGAGFLVRRKPDRAWPQRVSAWQPRRISVGPPRRPAVASVGHTSKGWRATSHQGSIRSILRCCWPYRSAT
jgi:hypothetical protein